MPIRNKRRMCVMFKRTESEKKNARMNAELSETKDRLNSTTKELKTTKKKLTSLEKEIAEIKAAISANVNTGNTDTEASGEEEKKEESNKE